MNSLIPVSLFITLASASCECGYKTNTGDVWQYAIETYFSNQTTASFGNSADWTIEKTTYYYSQSTSGASDLTYTPSNVAIDKGVAVLTCSAYSGSGAVQAGQIMTTREDIQYGSMRSKYAVSGGSGAVAGFFMYNNDTDECDVEIRTQDVKHYVHYTNQPDETQEVWLPNNLTTTSYITHRFDWFSDKVAYYANDVLSGTLTTDTPAGPGSIYLNMWSNGGSWSDGPPTTDAILNVQWVTLYFNSSNAGKITAFNTACAAAGSSSTKVCSVDSENVQTNTTAASSTKSQSSSHASATSSAVKSSTSVSSAIRSSSMSSKMIALSSSVLVVVAGSSTMSSPYKSSTTSSSYKLPSTSSSHKSSSTSSTHKSSSTSLHKPLTTSSSYKHLSSSSTRTTSIPKSSSTSSTSMHTATFTTSTKLATSSTTSPVTTSASVDTGYSSSDDSHSNNGHSNDNSNNSQSNNSANSDWLSSSSWETWLGNWFQSLGSKNNQGT